MILYSENNQTTNSQYFKYLDKGNCSTISKHGKIVLKIYNIDCKTMYRLRKPMFKQLKKLDDPNIVRLRNTYYHYKSAAYKLSSIDAYTMNYVEILPQKITELDRKQLLELSLSLEETLRRLSENKIVLRDVHLKNIVVNPDRIVILDPDMFYTLKTKSKSNIYRLNKNVLLFALNSIIEYETIEDEDRLIAPFFTNNIKQPFYENIKDTLTEDTIKQKIKITIAK